jgi:hypothetical protein
MKQSQMNKKQVLALKTAKLVPMWGFAFLMQTRTKWLTRMHRILTRENRMNYLKDHVS